MSSTSPSREITAQPSPQAYQTQSYLSQHRIFLRVCHCDPDKDPSSSGQLWRQMMIGFTCAGIVGLILLVLGTVFIAEAVREEQPIIVMLCVMGIVFGTIIMVGTIFLDRHLISRKWMKCQHGDSIPVSQCFHTCSVVYSPSLDQIGPSDSTVELPPAYDSVVSIMLQPLTSDPDGPAEACPVMVLPPKYEDVSQPLPDYYSDRSSSDDCQAMASMVAQSNM